MVKPGVRRRLLITTAVVLPLALCFLAVGAIFCAATLQPRRRVRVIHPSGEVVQLAANDGAVLRGSWFKASSGRCVIVLHGVADSRASSAGLAPMFLAAGYGVLAPDSRAHGESGGRFVTYGLREKYDVIGWTRWMRDHGCVRIYGFGESLGASTLIQAAAVEPAFAAIVAECPYADLRRVAEYRVARMSRLPRVLSVPIAKAVLVAATAYAELAYGFDFGQVLPLDNMRQTSTPILLIHGLDDFETPASESRELVAANPKAELWLVPGAEHCGASTAAPQEFRRRVLAWFAAHQ